MATIKNVFLTCTGCRENNKLHGLGPNGFFCLTCGTVHTNPYILDLPAANLGHSGNEFDEQFYREMARGTVP